MQSAVVLLRLLRVAPEGVRVFGNLKTALRWTSDGYKSKEKRMWDTFSIRLSICANTFCRGLHTNRNLPPRCFQILFVPTMGNCVGPSLSRSNSERIMRKKLKSLEDYDTSFILDDSKSMRICLPNDITRWKAAKDATYELAKEVAKRDRDGFDFFFMNDDRSLLKCKNAEALLDHFAPNYAQYDLTPMGNALGRVLATFLDRISERKATGGVIKPANIIVVTDGLPQDPGYVLEVILRTIVRLKELEQPRNKLGIQFVQIGNDEGATNFLNYLDKVFAIHYGIQDVIDTTKYDPTKPFNLVKICVGSFDKVVDEIDNVTENGYAEFYNLENGPALPPWMLPKQPHPQMAPSHIQSFSYPCENAASGGPTAPSLIYSGPATYSVPPATDSLNPTVENNAPIFLQNSQSFLHHWGNAAGDAPTASSGNYSNATHSAPNTTAPLYPTVENIPYFRLLVDGVPSATGPFRTLSLGSTMPQPSTLDSPTVPTTVVHDNGSLL